MLKCPLHLVSDMGIMKPNEPTENCFIGIIRGGSQNRAELGDCENKNHVLEICI